MSDFGKAYRLSPETDERFIRAAKRLDAAGWRRAVDRALLALEQSHKEDLADIAELRAEGRNVEDEGVAAKRFEACRIVAVMTIFTAMHIVGVRHFEGQAVPADTRKLVNMLAGDRDGDELLRGIISLELRDGARLMDRLEALGFGSALDLLFVEDDAVEVVLEAVIAEAAS